MPTLPTTAEIVAFHRVLTGYYYEAGRHDMLWRQPGQKGAFDPYKILVSEMMLQQTQVDRVTVKYQEFLAKFPTVHDLARAPLGDVLKLWNGLGYNRRAKYIWQAAQMVEKDFDGQFPETIDELKRIPGIGPNTAGAIMAYAYDAPVVFVETNIRTVIIHHFFADKQSVGDADIREVLAALVPVGPLTVDKEAKAVQGAILGPRQFYWAMMDYGSHLKKTVGNLNRASKHYTRQSKFEGSQRQVRGQVIRLLTAGPLTSRQLKQQVSDKRLDDVVAALIDEGLVVKQASTLKLS